MGISGQSAVSDAFLVSAKIDEIITESFAEDKAEAGHTREASLDGNEVEECEVKLKASVVFWEDISLNWVKPGTAAGYA